LREAEQLGEFGDRVRTSFVDLEEVTLLRGAEFGLPAVEVAFRFRDLHSFARSGSDEVGLELGHHREDVEQQPTDGVVRVVDGATDVELDVVVSSSTMSFASRRLRASRSSLAMTSVSPSRQEASTSRSPGRDLFVPVRP
jgi:hypothetical protein